MTNIIVRKWEIANLCRTRTKLGFSNKLWLYLGIRLKIITEAHIYTFEISTTIPLPKFEFYQNKIRREQDLFILALKIIESYYKMYIQINIKNISTLHLR